MTDKPDFEETLAKLETVQKRWHRVIRRDELINVGALLLLAAVNATLVLLLAPRAWVLRSLVSIGGLTVIGLTGHLYVVLLFRALVERDAELLQGLRREHVMAQSLADVRPLVEAVAEAHAHGASLMVMPPDGEPPPDEKTVH